MIAGTGQSSTSASIGKSVLWNYVGTASEIIAGFLLAAYVVRRISTDEYGLFLLAMALSSIVFMLDFGCASVLVQAYVAAAKISSECLANLLSTAFVALSALGAIGVLAFVAAAISLPGPFSIPSQYVHEAAIVFVLIALSTCAGMSVIALEYAYHAFNRFDRLNQIQISTTTLRVALTILVLSRGGGVVAFTTVQTIISAARLLVLRLLLTHTIPNARLQLRRFDIALLRKLFGSGSWAMLDNSARQLAHVSDSVILSVFGSVSSVALFGVAAKLPMQLFQVVMKGADVLLPFLAQCHVDTDQRDLRRVYLEAQKVIFTGLLPFVMLGCICARPLLQAWAGEKYASAAPIMQWLLIATLSMAVQHISALLAYARGEVKMAARMAVIESAANVILSLLLVFRYGAVGLAAGTAITNIVINAFWYTPAACRAAGITASDVISVVLVEDTWMFLLLTAEAAIIGVTWYLLSPLAVLIVGIVLGVAHMTVWGVRTAIPRLRSAS